MILDQHGKPIPSTLTALEEIVAYSSRYFLPKLLKKELEETALEKTLRENRIVNSLREPVR